MDINFLLVDALNLIRRVHAAQPGEDGAERVKNTVRSSVHSLQRAIRECAPTHVISVFEGQGESWRHQAYPGYKAGRSPMPDDLRTGLQEIEAAFRHVGVNSVSFPGLEADDVIATLAAKMASHEGRATVLSTDKVFLQLLSSRIRVRDHFQHRDLDAAYVKQKFGVPPSRFVDFLALVGDSTNNIKGLPGVGPRTAEKLLQEHETLDRILLDPASVGGKVGSNLEAHAAEVRLAQTLVALRIDLDLGLNLKSFRYTGKT